MMGQQPRSQSDKQSARGGNGALPVDIDARSRWLDQNDLAAIRGFPLVERNYSINSRGQGLACRHRNRRHRQRVVGAGADGCGRAHRETVDRGAVTPRDRRRGIDILAEHPSPGLIEHNLFQVEAAGRAVDPGNRSPDRHGTEFGHDIAASAANAC